MDDRKSRLAALAAKAGRNKQTSSNDGGNNQEDDARSKPTLSFRNYVPKDASLQPDASSSAAPPPEDGAGGGGRRQPTKRQKTSDRSVKDAAAAPPSGPPTSALELALAKTSRESREAAGQNVGAAGGWSKVTPVSTKKVNWDLKRDIQHKMEKLERRTQRAIVELLRERLEREAAEEGGAGGDEEDSDLD
eukprot:CAMPEP_0172554938 /NCGR_PEP_ID=MMETSP1067-20121228/57157_1 /TAXON_ID=265564 ORGANISM="Thalassiosira punctigera, Strain Tpunct2005C2" /NCGR_SAMPLE_ID=MMETSP1067 /ASSEMBLY_ACC=CAM_ASM_000444 /LENGTH=190 /DNA_ID=CAMNT_0013343419 /DNA_START=20 /DNA_END=592 /DNA_ORIENTATION=+